MDKKSTNTPLYQKIMKVLEERINKGVYSINDSVPSESELEREFQVSNITARRALNELANQDIIYRVKGGGSFVKNIPNELKGKEKLSSQKIVSLLLPFDKSAGRSSDIICGISDCLSKYDYCLNVVNCHDDMEEERRLLKKAVQSSDGVIFYPRFSNCHNDLLCLLSVKEYPLVTIDKTVAFEKLFSVVADNIGGSYELTKKMIELGHKEVCYISNSPLEYSSTVQERFMGFCKAMEEAKLLVSEKNYLLGFHDICLLVEQKYHEVIEARVYDAVIEHIIEQNPSITAIFALNDHLGKACLEALRRRGIDVPQQISVVGFDNLPFSSYLTPPLTTVEQDFYSMGKTAAEMLLERCQHKNVTARNAIIPTQVIMRESVRML